MSTKYVVETYADIIAAVQEELNADPNDSVITNRIKRDINHVYLQEVCPDQSWRWLNRKTEVQVKAFFSTGTVSVTAGDTAITFTTAPGYTAKGYLFSIDGYNEVYRIAQHTASSTSATLESPFTGTTDTAATFKIWQDTIALPADCEETILVRHNFRTVPLEGLGERAFQTKVAAGPRAVGRPDSYCTGSIVDAQPFSSISSLPATATRSSSGLVRTIKFASSLGSTTSTLLLQPGDKIQISGMGHYSYNGDFVVSDVSTTTNTNDTITYTALEVRSESSTADTGGTITKETQNNSYARYRELFVYPAIFDSVTTLYVDYKITPSPLVEDDDEPLIPREDRSVLVYGVLARQWVKHRDAEIFATNAQLYERKLGKMAGKIEDSLDQPKIQMSKSYMNAKRRGRYQRGFNPPTTSGFATGGGASVIQGTSNTVAVFDSTGAIGSSSTVSTTELGYLDGVTSSIQTQLDSKLDDPGLTASRAVVTDVSGDLSSSAVTSTELGYVSGVTSAIQTQIDLKAPKASPTFTGTVTTPLTTAGPVITDSSGVLSSEAALAVARGGTNSGTSLNNNRVMKSSGGAIVEAAAITASRALVSDANGIPTHSSVTSTELGYSSGVTSGIQTQLDAKIAKSLVTTTGDMIYASGASTPARLPVGSSGQFLKVAGGIPSWGPGASGINYLQSNPDAETDTSGWATYADAAGAQPVDGTGGSPTTTWTRTTSSPLRGTGSFLLTKDAANRQGEGASFAITLDSADQAKPICVSFDYAVASGTYADGDLTVYLYDVTNAVVIQPAPYRILSATAGLSQKWIGYFQTSAASTSYRLCVHVASTSASAYTVKFDNWQVGPTYQSYGAVETDWTAYTPTLSAGFGTTSNVSFFYKRVGDSLRVMGSFTTGTVAGSVGSISLPSGLSIDTSKITLANTTSGDGQVVGSWGGAGNGGAGLVVTALGTSATVVYTGDYLQNGSAHQTKPANVSGNFSSSIVAMINFTVPISGWSSNVQVSSDADTRVVAFYGSGNPASATSGNPIIFPTASYDTHGAYNTSTGRYTCAVPGYYKISGYISGSAAGVVIYLYKNAVQGAALGATVPTYFVTPISGTVQCNAGDIIDIRPGGTLDCDAASTLFIERISGPAQIAASETVAARYTLNSNQSINNSTVTVIGFDTKTYDTHNAVSGSGTTSFKFTAPSSGKYSVKSSVFFASAAWTANQAWDMYIYKNGSAYSLVTGVVYASLTTTPAAYINDTVNLNAGEYLDVRIDHNRGSATNVAGGSDGRGYIAIERVGN